MFFTLDLGSVFWQVGLQESDPEKSAFVAPHEKLEFLVMPFGLTGAPGTFQHLMTAVLVSGLQYEVCI